MALVVVSAVGASGCSSAGAGGAGGTKVTVLAAASLTEPFNAIKDEFTKQHPALTVEVSYGSSSALASQITNGAEADVFASADQANMAKVTGGDLVAGAVEVFARNTMAIVVPTGNPRGIRELKDLTGAGLRISLGAPPVPVGKAAREGFAKAGLRVPAATEEPDVKAVVSRVALGEADAGIAWVTDVRATKQGVELVEIPAGHNVVSDYPIVRLAAGKNGHGATALIEFIRSKSGQDILRRYGFQTI
ncbi:molybdate ABC transporter substrate-binding protein [Actinokineospora sp. HBU206404]|uniref:Molybdate ABC transporter substrate-binding protein n=2 Tax=Actinokineospora xionganensis TaxID=2684470 RepID=A0ABR7L0L0_9PSEU|nr:molybdate ABC transporter substrate-binding protein [Actinokineospora xionganensis]